jgi:uncharacterized membrane protein YhaH (DUF805 family)
MYTCKQFWIKSILFVVLSFIASVIIGFVSGPGFAIPSIAYCILSALLLTPVYTKRLADAGLPALYWWIVVGVHVVWGATAYVLDLMMADADSYRSFAQVMVALSVIGLIYIVGLTLVCGFKQSANNADKA